MSGYITWPCKQTAVYWPPASDEGGVDFDDYGKPQYGTAVEISCRWDDIVEEVVMADGTRDFSNAQVIVDQIVKVRGVLWLGVLTDVDDLDDPKANTNAFEIRQVLKNPDIDGRKTLVRAVL